MRIWYQSIRRVPGFRPFHPWWKIFLETRRKDMDYWYVYSECSVSAYFVSMFNPLSLPHSTVSYLGTLKGCKWLCLSQIHSACVQQSSFRDIVRRNNFTSSWNWVLELSQAQSCNLEVIWIRYWFCTRWTPAFSKRGCQDLRINTMMSLQPLSWTDVQFMFIYDWFLAGSVRSLHFLGETRSVCTLEFDLEDHGSSW